METATTKTETPIGKISVSRRTTTGKGPARRLRNEKLIPAILYYAAEKKNVMLKLNPITFQRALDPAKKRNTLFEVTIEGDGQKPEVISAMVKDYQYNAVKRALTHLDFVQVSLKEKVRATVPLVLEGKPEGVVMGGQLHQVFRKIPVECTPDKIPAAITVDVSKLKLNEALHVGQLPMPDGVTAVMPENQTCALVAAPRKEEEATASAATPEAAAAAPAAGDKAGAKPAAAAAKPAAAAAGKDKAKK